MSLSSAEFDPKDPVNSFASVWQRVMLEPRAFFEGLPATGGLQPPLAFAAICLAIGAFGFMIFGEPLDPDVVAVKDLPAAVALWRDLSAVGAASC